ncbi:unnamed protein product [Medioppia subpectinata]|uniref:Uncharacterized protein n=1 Tax=Medioppia subpectinata TaxID=1979941 RepID=A0A7R9KVG7_9ACAR|nr:unnamed protein product [Medioppia subpectinata]CAG2110454.1 unnamed protein product [Medioppia subpectinata]
MRFISRNRNRKIIVGVVFALFVIFIFTQSQESAKSLIKPSLTAKRDKTWEWSPEKLNEFMHLLDKHKQPVRNTSDHILRATNDSNPDNKLQFPALSKFLTYITDEESALMPAYVLSRRPINKRASIVIGVPHIRRSKGSYLQLTLYFLIKNIKPSDLNDTVIVVFIAETDMNYVLNTTKMIVHHFDDYITSGLLTVMSPPIAYYPDFDKLYTKQTLGDPLKRVHWRTKQNLDFAYLMIYSYTKGDYYLQLEDDVVSSPDYIGLIKQSINDLKTNKTEWFTMRYCRLGFIGQLLRSRDLPQLITFMLIFHEDQPSDWLLDYLIQTRVCRKDKDAKDCRKRKDSLWRTHKTSLFQHIGYHSSLDGKVQKLKDKFFKTKDFSYFSHKDNPSAEVMTSLTTYRDHTISKAYKGEDYFWAMDPKRGDNISFTFTTDVLLDEITINSGSFDHPNDKMPDETIVEILPQITDTNNANSSRKSDGYHIIGLFEDGFIQLHNLKNIGLVHSLRITITKPSPTWIILNEIYFKTFL